MKFKRSAATQPPPAGRGTALRTKITINTETPLSPAVQIFRMPRAGLPLTTIDGRRSELRTSAPGRRFLSIITAMYIRNKTSRTIEPHASVKKSGTGQRTDRSSIFSRKSTPFLRLPGKERMKKRSGKPRLLVERLSRAFYRGYHFRTKEAPSPPCIDAPSFRSENRDRTPR